MTKFQEKKRTQSPERRAEEAPAHAPSAESDLRGISHITDWQRVATPDKADASPSTATSRGFLGSIAHACKIALQSAAVWSGAGAAVMCIGSSPGGVVGHAISTLLTLKNLLRNTAAPESDTPAELSETSAFRRGFLGLMRDTVRSPGLNMLVGTVAYAIATVQAPNVMSRIAFASLFIGKSAVTYLSNLNFQGDRTHPGWLERGFKSAWAMIPNGFQNLLRNPAPWGSLGIILIVLDGLDVAAIANAPIMNSVLGIGVGISVVSLSVGVWGSISGQGQKPSGRASYILASGNFMLGLSSILHGNVPAGVANLLWSASNFLWGWALNRDRSKIEAAVRRT